MAGIGGELLRGAIDMHIHSAPDVVPRLSFPSFLDSLCQDVGEAVHLQVDGLSPARHLL